jgi:hydrogenase/urease accessory protein HupE
MTDRRPWFAGAPPLGQVLAQTAVQVLVAMLAAAAAFAHPLSPALLELLERPDGRVDVVWRTSTVQVPDADFAPELPAECTVAGPPEASADERYATVRWVAECGAGGLVGRRVAIRGLASAQTDALVRVQLRDGRVLQTVLRKRSPAYVVPARPSAWDVCAEYGRLGTEHILEGPDHLLFVFGLVLLVASTRMLVQTVTAFTVGHSITLSAAVLDLVRLPSAPVEVLIAVSILVLATELARNRPDTLMRRFPWLMAGTFGLLHGFGFAGALREAGLPQADVPLALFAFNVGIEIGQLLFVTLVVAAGVLLRRTWAAAGRVARLPAVYVMGVLAASWCYERVASWWVG